ncbi:MAG: hypothetical protein KGK07_12870 [Chloroflexota bacterium]|nr:hypothetical protein [Chloroflexota bacterium]
MTSKQSTSGHPECGHQHKPLGNSPLAQGDLIRIGDRRYTVCMHIPSERDSEGLDWDERGDYCGALVDVTDRPRVSACCGEHQS